jgi:hypothetical protein
MSDMSVENSACAVQMAFVCSSWHQLIGSVLTLLRLSIYRLMPPGLLSR